MTSVILTELLLPEARRAEALSGVEGGGPGRPAPGAGANRARLGRILTLVILSETPLPLPSEGPGRPAPGAGATRARLGRIPIRLCSKSRNFHSPAENSSCRSAIVPANSQMGAHTWPRA